MRTPVRFVLLVIGLLCFGCAERTFPQEGGAVLSPDYADAVVPYNIAPLNFCIDGADYARAKVEVKGATSSLTVRARHGRVMFPVKKWHRLLEAEKGNALLVTISATAKATSSGKSYTLHVSPDPIDAYVTYRIIDPSLEVWHHPTY